MKIYFIDKFGKYLNIKKKLEDLSFENIEHKENIKHRINKSDIVISFDFDGQYEEYKKVNNLIIVTETINKNDIWNIANKLNTKDIILYKKENEEYIANRIKNTILN